MSGGHLNPIVCWSRKTMAGEPSESENGSRVMPFSLVPPLSIRRPRRIAAFPNGVRLHSRQCERCPVVFSERDAFALPPHRRREIIKAFRVLNYLAALRVHNRRRIPRQGRGRVSLFTLAYMTASQSWRRGDGRGDSPLLH